MLDVKLLASPCKYCVNPDFNISLKNWHEDWYFIYPNNPIDMGCRSKKNCRFREGNSLQKIRTEQKYVRETDL